MAEPEEEGTRDPGGAEIDAAVKGLLGTLLTQLDEAFGTEGLTPPVDAADDARVAGHVRWALMEYLEAQGLGARGDALRVDAAFVSEHGRGILEAVMKHVGDEVFRETAGQAEREAPEAALPRVELDFSGLFGEPEDDEGATSD